MTKRNYWPIALLMALALLIFLPLFYTDYFYTDEIIQLWNYRPGSGYHMFVGQGRLLTDLLFSFLFGSIDSIRQIKHLHIFSLLGWIACLPVWYLLLTRVVRREELHYSLPFLTVLYLIASLPFAVYVSWAATMELFIANTSGFIAGYCLYAGLRQDGKRISISARHGIGALFFALISLFSYQNGLGCFFIPFLLAFVKKKTLSPILLVAVATYFLCFGIYYVLFHWQLTGTAGGISDRGGLTSNPLNKIVFFIARPLAGAFRFNWIVNERHWSALLIPAAPLLFIVIRNRSLRFLFLLFGILLLIYLPSLVVKENYASNRTMLALDLAAFILMTTTLLDWGWLRKTGRRQGLACCLCFLLIAQACYNFHIGFLRPVREEYAKVRACLNANYKSGISTVFFIRPSADFFERKYGIVRSWDEFGLPSTSQQWVPAAFVRQVIFENTGSRKIADSVQVVNLVDRTMMNLPDSQQAHRFVLDVEKILQ